MTKLRFEELNLSQEILNAVKDMGFEEASPIQAESIPLVIDGKDIIGQAQTGTGKTAAFAIPVIEKLDAANKDIQAVILCPTRELVIQVADEFRKLMKYKENLYVIPVYGGQEIERQLRALKKGAQVVIGTPGRTMDHIRRGSIKMSSVQTLVLDEADEMLDMGFREDIEFILKDTPSTRQTVMFSATMAKDIMDLTKQYQNSPVVINVTHKKVDSPKIQQVYFEVLEKNKPEVLARLIDIHNVKLALVFCNTKSMVDQLVETLKTRGYFADALHGDMNQNQRDRVMNGFRNGSIEILVATDVAGRGIDVNDVEAVFNYDLPRDDEDYIHRIGRTGRAGKKGIAFTFISGKQVYNLKRIERSNGVQIIRHSIPTIDEIEATKINSYAEKIGGVIANGHLSKYINHLDILMGEDYTSLDVAAALLKIIMEKESESFDKTVDFTMPKESPAPQKRFQDKRSGGGGYQRRDGARRPSGERSAKRPEKREFENKEFDKDYKPFKPSEKRPEKREFGNKEFEKDYKPFKSSTKRPEKREFENKEFESEYKPFKSSEKRKETDSFKYGKPKSEKKSEFKKEGGYPKSTRKEKGSDTYKDASSPKKSYNKPTDKKNSGKKFDK